KDTIFKGGSHGSTLQIIPEEQARDMEKQLPTIPTGSNHFANFLKACKGEEQTRSPFSISGPLSQVFCLGVIAQRLNTNFEFDITKKQVVNNAVVNALLVWPPPRKDWEDFYVV